MRHFTIMSCSENLQRHDLGRESIVEERLISQLDLLSVFHV